MQEAIKSCLVSDVVSCNPHQELQDYLATPLEEVDNVVAWWSVSEEHDLNSHLLTSLNFDSAIPFNIPLCLKLQKTTSPFKDLLCHQSAHFPAVASQQLPATMLSCQKLSELSKY